jgi:hypothetical protein
MFIYEMGQEAKDLTKCQKIDDLCVSESEWDRIGLFNSLLAGCHVFLTQFRHYLHGALSSMPIMCNKLSRLIER